MCPVLLANVIEIESLFFGAVLLLLLFLEHAAMAKKLKSSAKIIGCFILFDLEVQDSCISGIKNVITVY